MTLAYASTDAVHVFPSSRIIRSKYDGEDRNDDHILGISIGRRQKSATATSHASEITKQYDIIAFWFDI